MTLGLFCYLYDEEKFLKSYKTARNGGANRKLCGDRNKYSTISKIAKKFSNGNEKEILKNWTNIMIVREPISRFINGFVQICVLNIGLQQNHPYCFNCGENMKYFIKRIYNHTQNLNRKLTSTDIFIMYHLYPQSWHFEYLEYKDSYKIIFYTGNSKSFNKEYLSKLKDIIVSSDKIEFTKKLISNREITHSTSSKKITKHYKYKLLKDKYLMKLFKRIFEEDYIEFNLKKKKFFL